MDKDREKKIDDFIRKTVLEVGIEKPSENFTSALMAKITTSSEIVYKPLISKSVLWLLLGLCLLVVTGMFFIEAPVVSAELHNLSVSTSKLIAPIHNFSTKMMSNTYIYGFLALTFFVCIQVVILKNRLNKQYSI